MSAYENSEDKVEARDLADLAAAIVDWAGGPTVLSFEDALPTAWKHFDLAAAFVAEQAALSVPPTLTSLTPAELTVPGVDTEVVFSGTGFNANTVINWNGGDEVTDFLSETELRTTVKPSTVQAPLPFALPVYVHHGDVQSNVLEFTFIEEPPITRRKARDADRD